MANVKLNGSNVISCTESDLVSPQEIIKAAGLDFSVEKSEAEKYDKVFDILHKQKFSNFGVHTVQIGPKNKYKFIRDIFADSAGSKSIKEHFREVNRLLLEEGGFELVKGADGDILEAISSHPITILEPDFQPPENFSDLFVEEGKINLPFPFLTVLTVANLNEKYGLKENGWNMVIPYYISQGSKGNIFVHHIMGSNTSNRKIISTIELRVFCNDMGQVGIFESIPQSQWGLVDSYSLKHILWAVLATIYMLTYHTGKVHMSKPTIEDSLVNKKRARKGKAPLIEFKLVSITGKEIKREIQPHGTHAAPKQHWRRGHWRNCSSGKRAWIAPMLVGDEKNGKIIKDYAVGDYRDSGSHAIIR
jgi:hypothetical protein